METTFPTDHLLHPELFAARATVRDTNLLTARTARSRRRLRSACAYLKRRGDWIDVREAEMLERALDTEEAAARDLNAERGGTMIWGIMGGAFGVFAMLWAPKIIAGAIAFFGGLLGGLF